MEQMKILLKGDTGINCHYCYGANHLAVDCLLRKKEEQKSKTKDEAYYTEKLEEVKKKAKNLSLVAHGETESDGTYQIWSSGSDDEEMKNPTHGAMYAKMEEDSDDDEQNDEVCGRCFVSNSTDKSPMTTKVRNILESFNIPVSAYNYELVSFDETVTYFDSIIVSASNEAKKLSDQLLETRKMLDSKVTRIDYLELQVSNIMEDREQLGKEVNLLLAQRNVFCNSAKRLYGKLTELHHSCEISKEQHRKLLPFLAYDRAKVDRS